ncbi:SDR family NAD(P)-dependent oxidoreductase [Agromyces aerolatus]|uniref:SDR family NAD(P)-dependent oxidoreductase n=1 Tax=Agromyces sp. LY-1074 TaxID=3074080 RepID=UPI002860DE1C|nr:MULTISPECIES: SDR family oxidoreductase [unclassified Agromyces]MDR5700511.1 SDR family oxidoreductase [Agromyces sp. LY-1074]MDR5707032.1 SDR family oxidoreductase [Agromyces sp. LY-1358]
MRRLEDTTILVTGASRGIGAATTRILSERGASVIAQYNSTPAGAEAATADAPERLLVRADFTDPAAPDALWDEAVAWKGRIDAVVCNAAILPSVGFDAPASEWDATWELALRVNTLAPAALLRRAVQHHVEHGGGIVVGLSSWAAQRGSANPALAAYSASKAAFAAALKTAATAYAAQGLLAYLIAPGVVDTEMSESAAAAAGGAEAVSAKLAMREWVPPQDIAELVAVLCEGRIRHLTGATLDVNGASYIR